MTVGRENAGMLFLDSFKGRDLNDPFSSELNWL